MVVILGSVNADLVARVESLPREGRTQVATGYAVHAGGKGANQALAARRAGADVALAGSIGNDGFADVALATLREAGVDITRVATVDGPTGIALIHVDARGRNTITVVPGANALVRADAVADAALGPGTVVALQLEIPIDEVGALARRAHRLGARVILNVAPPAPLHEDLLDAVDVLVANEHEAAVVAHGAGLPADPGPFCAAAADRWGLAAIVTLGAEGLVAADASRAYRVPAARVDTVDTTAAGDAFVGALAAALDRGAPLADALADGAAAGSHACTGHGAQPSIGTRAKWRGAALVVAASSVIEAR
ncbi:ribokinase [Burkholderiales bacterium]|nr:ribokinase [Burkholderiales bacterium]